MKLTDTHLVLLSAAAQDPNHLLPSPDHISDKAAEPLANKLIRAGLVQEVAIRSGQPHWRVEDDRLLGLQITPDGLAALGLDEPDELLASACHNPEPQPATASRAPSVGQPARAPRSGSKQAAVLDLLRRDEGATLDELIAATGWLPHTTRAALTGLRQRGYEIARSTGESGRGIYRIRPEPDAPVALGGEG